MKICSECKKSKTHYHLSMSKDADCEPTYKSVCADCENTAYNKRNAVKNYKNSKMRSGMRKKEILEAAKKILSSGQPLSARIIARAVGSKNTGLVNYHFGSMNELLIILDKGLEDD